MIIVFNVGSSSIKYKLFEIKSDKIIEISENSVSNIKPSEKEFEKSFKALVSGLNNYLNSIKFVGYRVVFGGDLLDGAETTQSAIDEIESQKQFAPLHNPNAILCIKLSKSIFLNAHHLCFLDTSYFKNMPSLEQNIPIDLEVIKKYKLRRHGFHGISHEYAYQTIKPHKNEKVITIHLGAGCSISAIFHGEPIATSMGLTPLEGLIMQSRGGNIDPGTVMFLIEKFGLSKVKEILNNKSGLTGMTKTNGNMLDLLYLAGERIEDKNYLPDKSLSKNDKNYQLAKFALDAYCNSVKKYIGAYSALLGGVDRIIFTGKIGAGSNVIRKKIMNKLDYLKIKNIDIVKPDEERAIAQKILKIVKK